VASPSTGFCSTRGLICFHVKLTLIFHLEFLKKERKKNISSCIFPCFLWVCVAIEVSQTAGKQPSEIIIESSSVILLN
jgi:hypothetical protein